MRHHILGLLLSAGALLVVMVSAFDGDAAATRAGPQVLQLTDGTKVNAIFNQGSRSFSVALKDGTYKLSNGGAIRVQGGKIVWDAFGAIDKLRRGAAAPNPIG